MNTRKIYLSFLHFEPLNFKNTLVYTLIYVKDFVIDITWTRGKFIK